MLIPLSFDLAYWRLTVKFQVQWKSPNCKRKLAVSRNMLFAKITQKYHNFFLSSFLHYFWDRFLKIKMYNTLLVTRGDWSIGMNNVTNFYSHASLLNLVICCLVCLVIVNEGRFLHASTVVISYECG